MNVELPDGTVIEDVPDNISRADFIVALKRNGYDVGGLGFGPEKQLQSKEGDVAVGALEAGLSMATSVPASVAGGLSGLVGAGWNALTGGEDPLKRGAEISQGVQNFFTYSPKTEGGEMVQQAVAVPFELANKGLGYAGEVVGDEAGRTIGENVVPVAATLYGGYGALKGAPKSTRPTQIVPEAIKDAVRTRSKKGHQQLAEKYLRELTTPEEAAKIVQALERRGREVVPKSPVTSAEAIARANREAALKGSPERFGGQYVALQEGLAAVPETSSGLRTVQLQQEAARTAALKKGAGTDVQRAALEQTRAANAARNYQAVNQSQAVVDTGRTVGLIDRIIRAKPGNRQLVAVLDDVRTSLTEIDSRTGLARPRTNPGQLQSSIEHINNLLTNKENAAARRHLVTVKKSLEHQIGKVEQAQRTATRQYQIDSLPLDQMDLWGAMRDKFVSPTGKEAPGTYLKALRDETKLIKQATGFKRGSGIDKIFNQEQSALAARLAAEMEMELVKKRMASEVNLPGIGKAAQNMEPRLPNMLMRETMVANFMLRMMAKSANVDVNIVAANILKDPKALAGVLKQVKVDHRPTVLKAIKDAAVSQKTLAVGATLEAE